MRLIGLGIAVAWAALETTEMLDRVLCRVSLYRWSRAAVLDSLFGPEEQFEYAGATTPSEPPAS